jgi:hypothetical protein
MIFSMPYLPEVSVNHSHTRNRYTGQPIKKPEAKKWQMVLAAQVHTWADEQQVSLIPGGNVIIWLTAEFPLQGGTRANPDNFLKLAQDAIAQGLGTDDDVYPFYARVKTAVYNQPPHQGNLHYEILINAQEN